MKTSKRTRRSRAPSPATQSGKIEGVLWSIGQAARKLKSGWFLFGAQAVALHGVPRSTQDVDVTLVGEQPPELLFRELRRAGIEPLIDDPAFVAAARVIPATHAKSGWKVDVILGATPFEATIEREALRIQVGRVTVPLIRAEHLVALKVLAGRPQDLVDVRSIIRIKGPALDLKESRELLKSLERELGESDLVDRLDALATG